jgi:uncharacterized protein (TIGR03437 family)
VSLSYTKGSTTPTSTTSTITADADGVAYTSISAVSWLTAAPTTTANTTSGDICTLVLVTSVADHMAAGVYTSVVPIVPTLGGTPTSVTVTLTITSGTSPLSSNPVAITLTYAKNGGASQALATVAATISSNDTLYDNYSVAAGYPTWLTVTPLNSKAKIGTTDTLTFAAASAFANALAVNTYTYTVHLAAAANPDLTVLVTLHVVNQPLVSSVASVSLNYIKGGGGTLTKNVSISVAAGSAPFALDVATLPLWLTVTGAPGTATSGGVTVTFTVVNTVATNMAVGNYSANVGLAAAGFSDLLIPVSFLVSNSAPSVSLLEGTTEIDKVWLQGSTRPTPVVTPFSSNEPVPFTAACVVQSSAPGYVFAVNTDCVLNAPTGVTSAASGVAFTTGAPLTVTFAPALFASTVLLGTTVKVTVTVNPAGGSPLVLAYKYTIQPVPPTINANGISPTSAALIPTGTSLVVLLKGNNFVGPANIAPGSPLVPTQVFVGATNTNLTSNSVVLSATQMMVTIPRTSFPTTITGTVKSAPLAIGLANETGLAAPTVPTATVNLTVTTSPVIYGIVSTASYQQPAIGVSPGFAAYELVSIFGDNFGPTSPAVVIAPLDANNRVSSSLILSGSGTSAVTLKVTFKTTDGKTSFSAPVLFASQNQINSIVPSGMTIGAMNVSVSSGTPVSDNFPVNVVAADPGIFTLQSDGVGAGAILNADFSVNKVGNEAKIGQSVSIYLTGLGAPDSTTLDTSAATGGFPSACVAISNTGKNTPGYMQVVNTAATGYVPPTPAWTSIDGAVIQPSKILGSGLPPCMATATVTVTFGTATPVMATYAGFVDGAVAGLYQVNATIPAMPSVLGPVVLPVMVTITPTAGSAASSQPTAVTMAIKP